MPKRFSKPALSRQKNLVHLADDANNADSANDTNSANSATSSANATNTNGANTAATDASAPTTLRLDRALTALFPQYSRSTLQKFIRNRCVRADHVVVDDPSAPVSTDTALSLQLPANARTFTPKLLAETAHIRVYDKPQGMLSFSKGDYNPEPTMMDYGAPAHRLDRDTSGVIILARDPETKAFLQKQFQTRHAHKTYYTVVLGHPKLTHAVIDLPIARNPKRPNTFIVAENGRSAVTEYTVVQSGAKYSLLKIRLYTGRTHQIRVHLSHLGHPVLGDTLYNPNGPQASRMFLHAYALEITIPGETGKNNQRQTFIAPLPEEFNRAII